MEKHRKQQIVKLGAVIFLFSWCIWAFELNNQCAGMIWGNGLDKVTLEIFSLPVLGLWYTSFSQWYNFLWLMMGISLLGIIACLWFWE